MPQKRSKESGPKRIQKRSKVQNGSKHGLKKVQKGSKRVQKGSQKDPKRVQRVQKGFKWVKKNPKRIQNRATIILRTD